MQVKNICTLASISLCLCFVSPLGSLSLPTSNNGTMARKNTWSKPWKRKTLNDAQKYRLPEPSELALQRVTDQVQELSSYGNQSLRLSKGQQAYYFAPFVSEQENKAWKYEPWQAIAAYRPKDVIEITFRVFAGVLFFWAYVVTPTFDFLKQVTDSKPHVSYNRYYDYASAGHQGDYYPDAAARLAVLDYSTDPPAYTGFGRDYCMQRIACEILDWTSTLRGQGIETLHYPRTFEHYNFTTGWPSHLAEREGCAKFPCRPIQSFLRFLLYTLDWNTILKATF